MRVVLHIGPSQSRGGMAAVIGALAAAPPDGWRSEVLATHADGGAFNVWRAWRGGRRRLRARIRRGGVDIAHVHVAADWSWWRKARILRMLHRAGIPTILHVHTGNFDAFCSRDGGRRGREVAATLGETGALPVTLTPQWRERLHPWLGRSRVVSNPAPLPPDPQVAPGSRDRRAFAMVGRPKPVKNHRLAIEVVEQLRATGHAITLHLLGVEPDDRMLADTSPAIVGHGWLSGEEKHAVLDGCGTLLAPSLWEGQSMAVLEAMSRGMPVLSSSASEGVFHEAGHILPNLKPKTWMQFMHSLLENEATWMAMAAAGPGEVAESTIEVVRDRWGELYAEAAGSERTEVDG